MLSFLLGASVCLSLVNSSLTPEDFFLFLVGNRLFPGLCCNMNFCFLEKTSLSPAPEEPGPTRSWTAWCCWSGRWPARAWRSVLAPIFLGLILSSCSLFFWHFHLFKAPWLRSWTYLTLRVPHVFFTNKSFTVKTYFYRVEIESTCRARVTCFSAPVLISPFRPILTCFSD